MMRLAIGTRTVSSTTPFVPPPNPEGQAPERLGKTRTIVLGVLLVAFAGLGNRSCHAQLSDAQREKLAAAAEEAADLIDSSRFPNFELAATEVTQQIRRVSAYLSKQTTADNREAWLQYLQLDPLLQAIESNQEPAAIAREAIDVRSRLVGTAVGLEMEVLQQLRQDVVRLIESVRYGQPGAAKSLQAQLKSLAKRVQRMESSPSADSFAAVSFIVGLLQSSNQSPELVQSLRDSFGRPNVAVTISESMVQQAVERQIDQVQAVNDCILGTRVIGNASLNGTVTADLIPSNDSALINVSLDGQVISNSRGYNGPVKLRSLGVGNVASSRVISIDPAGVRLGPTTTNATLRTDILSIDHPLRIVRKIARKKAAEQKPLAERIATDKLRRQVGEQFAKETRETISIDADDPFAELRLMLARIDLPEPAREWSSTDQSMRVEAMVRNDKQLASITPRPDIETDFSVALQLHESAIDNAVASVLSGRTVNETELNDLFAQARGQSKSDRVEADENRDVDEEDQAPFEIDFSRLRPIIFEARDGQIRIGLRGTRFLQGNRELKRALEITAEYRPIQQDGRVLLQRQGDVKVDFPGRGRLTIGQAGLRRTIEKKFADLFPAQLLDQSIQIPDDAKVEPLRGRSFAPQQVTATDGWLSVALQ